VTQVGCGPAQACRHEARGGMVLSVACEAVHGTLLDHNWPLPLGSGCLNDDFEDLCARGLFCSAHGSCRRYCEPDGVPCPDDPNGTPQRCARAGETLATEGVAICLRCTRGVDC
jgi:hypothetical protein